MKNIYESTAETQSKKQMNEPMSIILGSTQKRGFVPDSKRKLNMNDQRRNFIRLTAAGLIHVAAQPFEATADEKNDSDFLIRQAAQRGHTDLGWLDSYHTFSFGNYYDQSHMSFRSLRVINDDRITPCQGFPTHPHRNMEILSIVLSGALQHRDSTGKGSIVRPGDVQMMTAGKGITHSEYNPSKIEENHFLQIWIQPSLSGLRPSYQQQRIEPEQKQNRWQQIAAPDEQQGVVEIHQDARIFAAALEPNKSLDYVVERRRHAWLHVATGQLIVNGVRLEAGDAVATSRPTAIHVEGIAKADILLFDLG